MVGLECGMKRVWYEQSAVQTECGGFECGMNRVWFEQSVVTNRVW